MKSGPHGRDCFSTDTLGVFSRGFWNGSLSAILPAKPRWDLCVDTPIIVESDGLIACRGFYMHGLLSYDESLLACQLPRALESPLRWAFCLPECIPRNPRLAAISEGHVN